MIYALLRIRTIYLEIIEKNGLPYDKDQFNLQNIEEDQFEETKQSPKNNIANQSNQGQMSNPQEDYSKNYFQLLLANPEKQQAILQKVQEIFRVDQWTIKPKNKFSVHDTQLYPKGRFSQILRTFGDQFILWALKFDLSEALQISKKVVVWQDVRISRSYLRYIIRKFEHHSGQKQLQDQTKVQQETQLLIWNLTNIQMGYLDHKFYEVNQPRQIAFQTLIRSQIGVAIIQPRRIALYDDNNNVKAFAFYQYVELLYQYKVQIRDSRNRGFYWNSILNRFNREFIEKHKNNPNTFLCFQPHIVFQNLPPGQRQAAAFNANSLVIIEKNQIGQPALKPILFNDIPVDPQIQSKFVKLASGEFCCEIEFEKFQEKDKFKSADSSIIKNVADEQGGFQLLRLIKSVPNLKFKLTSEQELMISTPSNLLCLGRSGTGKTTTSALRLFATEAYYKYHDLYRKFKLDNPNARNAEFKVPNDFIKQSSNVKLLFVSASPVLVNEVKRFFIEFKSHFTLELEKKRQNQVAEEVKIEQTDSDFLNYVEMEIKELEQEEQLEKQQSLVTSMDMLNSEDFPLFLTVKRLLYMLDASTDFPFFSRDKDGNQIGIDSNVQWHNESGGVFMINQYLKSNNDIDLQLKQLGLKLVEYTAQLEDGTELKDQQENEQYEKPQQSKSNEYSIGLGDLIDTSSYQSQRGFTCQSQNLSSEVDFELFKVKFWPKVAPKTNLTPIIVWTEICSEIKGRYDSWKYDFGGIPDSLYVKLNRAKNHFLSGQERFQVYEIFLMYEKWKSSQGSYDLNDLVNHILKQVKVSLLKQSQTVHFLMVDEVQDLSQNIISLFMMLADKNVFFSGDTAQTIAKGVGFRFFDLKQVFTRQNNESQINFQVPKVLQLVKNFRSHSKILDLANSVVSLLELLFPKTIDKLLKEKSDIDGPRPIVIDCEKNSIQKLLEKYLLFGSVSIKKESNKQQTQFGCTQVIIVRDQESKERIPDFMKDLLCLTIYEAKGLEFDDVILFNFFQDSKCESQWKLLNDIIITQTREKLAQKLDFLEFDSLECEDKLPLQINEANDGFTEINTTNNQSENNQEDIETQITSVLSLKSHHDLVYRKFALVCTELKLLYVAITRPKNLLIIYDESNESRKPIQEYWRATNVIDFIDRKMLNNYDLIPPQIRQTLRISDTPDIIKNPKLLGHQSESLKQTWMLQGLKLFKVRFYRAAAQCFQNIGQTDLYKRCQAYESADYAAQLRGQHDHKLAQATDKSNIFSKQERTQLKKEAKELFAKFKEQMIVAGKLFSEINLNQHAAQCFYSAGNLKESSELFIKQGKSGHAAECLYKLGQYKKAASLYCEAKLFSNAFECYERLEDWDGLIISLHKYKEFFGAKEREMLLQKYFPIALNSVYQFYGQLQQDEGDQFLSEENKGKIQQMKLKLKFQKSVSIIEELNAEQVESSESESEEVLNDQNQSDKLDQSNKSQQQSNEKEEIVQIDTNQVQENSYSIIDDQEQESITNQDKQNYQDASALEIEILSNIDPNDEFLQSAKAFSIIESVSLNDSSFSVLNSQTENSEYSIISGSSVYSVIKSMASFKEAFEKSNNQTIDLDEMGNSQSVSQSSSLFDLSRYSVIGQNQQQDCFAEDMVVQKVIYYISLFRKEVMEHLNKTTDRQNPLIKTINEQAIEEIQDEFMYIDLDEISDEILKVVVEILEYYEMYRLCLIIYNRFKMSDRIGIFVEAICLKYSNLSQFRVFCTETFQKPAEKEAQRKYALLAHEAIQNVLSLISSTSQRNDWLDQSFNCLFLQGYWKKTVFLLECWKSIELCWVMGDINSLKLQFLVQKAGISDHEQLHRGLSSYKEFNKLVQSQSKDSQFALVKSAIYEQESQDLISQFKQLISKSGHSCRQINELLRHTIKQQSFCIQCWTLLNKPQAWIDQQSRLPFTKYLQNESLSTLKTSTFVFGILAHYKQLKNKYWQTHFLDVMLYGIQLLSKAFHGDQVLKKTFFKSYGVSLLDGLELFGIFSNNYCIVRSDSQIFQDIVDRQELALIEIRTKLLKELLEEQLIRYPNENYYKQLQTVKLILKEEMKQPDLKYQFESKHAIVCDINLGFYLVPKSWVKEIIIRQFVQQIIDFISVQNNQQIITSLHSNEEVQVEILASTYTFASRMFKKSQKSEFSTQLTALKNLFKYADQNKKKEDTLKQAYKYCFGIEIDQIFEKCGRSCFMKSNSDLINDIYRLKVKALSKLSKYSDQQIVKLMIKPEYQFFQQKQTNYGRHLEIAINYFNESKTAVRNEKIADSCYKIWQSFIRIDAEIILLELLQQKNNNSTQLQKNRNNNIRLLLSAHHYSKCNNLIETSNYLIKFLAETYTTLSFVYFKEIITEAFSKAWFSFQIYNSTEGKVKMQALCAQTVSNQLKPISNTPNFVHELQDIRIQVGNMQIVNKALIWVECFLMNLIQYEGYQDYFYMLEYGLTVVKTVLNADLTPDQLNYFWPKIQLICVALMRKVEELEGVKIPKLIQQIANLSVKAQQKSATTQMLQIVDQLRSCDKSVYVCYHIKDRKSVMNRINQIQIDVENCHIQAIEKSNSLQKIRLEAANKIYQFWSNKKSSKQTEPQLNDHQVKIVLNYADFIVPLDGQNRGQNLRFLISNTSGVATFLQKSAEIQFKITQFTCSRLVNSSFNFNKFIELLKKVIEIENNYLKQLQVQKDIQLQDILTKQLELTIQQFDEAVMLLKQQNEDKVQSNTDIQERKRFQKREKWENVIQFHKKKRLMLKHFKSTMSKLN